MGKIAINIATGSLQKEEIIVGIDLGTTNSLVAVIHPDTGKPTVLREHDNSSMVPSVVYIDKTGNTVVGEEAKGLLISAPERTIFSVKRLLGKNAADAIDAAALPYKTTHAGSNGNLQIHLDDRFYSPADISAMILSALKTRAEHILKTPVTRAVITVPAYFNDAQRQETRKPGSLPASTCSVSLMSPQRQVSLTVSVCSKVRKRR